VIAWLRPLLRSQRACKLRELYEPKEGFLEGQERAPGQEGREILQKVRHAGPVAKNVIWNKSKRATLRAGPKGKMDIEESSEL